MTAKQMKTFWPAFNSACRELGLFDEAEGAFLKAAGADSKYWVPHYNLGDL